MGCAKEYLRISWFWDASEFIVYKICDFEIFQTLKLDGQYQEYSIEFRDFELNMFQSLYDYK